MRFKDRQEAANKLYEKLKENPFFKKKAVIVVSLLRGGVVLGTVLAKKMNAPHLPLVVTKIPAPYNEELAIGALCFDITFLEKNIVSLLGLKSPELREQIKLAEHKFIQSCTSFGIKEKDFTQVKNHSAIVVDDGVATGASVRTAFLFLLSKGAKEISLAVPIASADTKLEGFKRLYILHRPKSLGAVSQFYKNFPQLENKEVKRMIKLQ